MSLGDIDRATEELGKQFDSEYKVQYIRPLTLAEIAFFEARMSLAKQAKGGIPHIYMKGRN